jgi:hypothetical protein
VVQVVSLITFQFINKVSFFISLVLFIAPICNIKDIYMLC